MKVDIPLIVSRPEWDGTIEGLTRVESIELVDCCATPDLTIGWTTIPRFPPKEFGYPHLRCQCCGKRVDAGYDELSHVCLKFIEYEWNRRAKNDNHHK